MPTYETPTPAAAEQATLSPHTFVANLDVIAEDAQLVVDGANYCVCTTPVHYCGGWGADLNFLDDAFQQPSGDKIGFDAALNTWERRGGVHTIKIGANVATLRFLARCLVGAGETVEVRILFDTIVRATLAFTDADNGASVEDSISVATIGGPDFYGVEIEIRRTSSATTNNLIQWSLDGEARDVATLPAPAG